MTITKQRLDDLRNAAHHSYWVISTTEDELTELFDLAERQLSTEQEKGECVKDWQAGNILDDNGRVIGVIWGASGGCCHRAAEKGGSDMVRLNRRLADRCEDCGQPICVCDEGLTYKDEPTPPQAEPELMTAKAAYDHLWAVKTELDAEIARLTKELNAANGALANAHSANDLHRTEIAKLREALEQIADLGDVRADEAGWIAGKALQGE